MERGGPTLKAFAPQLQTTFVKSLSDPMREVRNRGGQALGKLMQISLRVDPLLTELTTLSMQADSNAIRNSIMEAIISVMALGGDKASAPVLEKVKNAALKNIYDEDDPVRNTAAKCLGSIAGFLSIAAISDVVLDLLSDASSSGLSPSDEPWSLVCGRVVGLASVINCSGTKSEEFHQEIFSYFQTVGKEDDRISTRIALAK